MKDYFKKYSKYSLVFSILLLILSLFLIFMPIKTVDVLVIFLGSILLLAGVFNIIVYFKNSKEIKPYSSELAIGLILSLVGLLFIIRPLLISFIFEYIIAVCIILEGIFNMQTAFNLKSSGEEKTNWILTLILAIITIILGVVLFFNPFTSWIAFISLTGIFLLVSQIFNIIESIFILTKLK